MFTLNRQCELLFIVILFTTINFCDTQIIPSEFRPSDVDITPSLVIMNSTSSVNFTCSNRQTNQLPLEAGLSKIIPSDEMQLFTDILNNTTIHIRLESRNYVGLFHLLCYSKGEQNKGTRADVIVVAAPGVLQLAEHCRVYDRQYIKCIIRAPTIARAAQNGYPVTFEFDEISHSPDLLAYRPQFEFLKNESTSENLTFKWQPTIDGVFPNGVRMHMKALLAHFDPSSYYFDMTPIFQITPKFRLQAISPNQIRMNITPSTPAAFCERSVLPKLTSNITQAWTVMKSDRNDLLIDNLIPNSIYRVCMKCRQTYDDPDGLERCQEMKTLTRLNWFFHQKYLLLFIGLLLFLCIILGFTYLFWKKRCTHNYSKVRESYTKRLNKPDQVYDSRESSIKSYSPIYEIPTDSPSESNYNRVDSDNSSNYHPIASLIDALEQTTPPELLASSED